MLIRSQREGSKTVLMKCEKLKRKVGVVPNTYHSLLLLIGKHSDLVNTLEMLCYYFYLKFKSVLRLEVGTVVVYVEDRAAKLVNEDIFLISGGINQRLYI